MVEFIEMDVHLILKNELIEIQRLAQRVTIFAEEQQLSAEVAHDLNLVLEEVVSNIILYGYEDTFEHMLDVWIGIQGSTIAIKIHDDGKPFNPLEASDPDLDIPLEDREIGGLGIYLTRTLMDDLEYERTQEKNVLRMKKELS